MLACYVLDSIINIVLNKLLMPESRINHFQWGTKRREGHSIWCKIVQPKNKAACLLLKPCLGALNVFIGRKNNKSPNDSMHFDLKCHCTHFRDGKWVGGLGWGWNGSDCKWAEGNLGRVKCSKSVLWWWGHSYRFLWKSSDYALSGSYGI